MKVIKLNKKRDNAQTLSLSTEGMFKMIQSVSMHFNFIIIVFSGIPLFVLCGYFLGRPTIKTGNPKTTITKCILPIQMEYKNGIRYVTVGEGDQYL